MEQESLDMSSKKFLKTHAKNQENVAESKKNTTQKINFRTGVNKHQH
jgi:hypothetical protein